MNRSLTTAYEQFITLGVMTLVDELISLRESRGVSQEEVATSVGVDQSAVSYWERKKTQPSGSARILLKAFVEELKKRPAKSKAAA
jgi:DNA-binding transcriptional regulator YiaG